MAIEVSAFGKTKDGREATLFTITNASGMTAKLTNYGATLVSLLVPDRNGELADVVLGYDNVADYETYDGHLGATIGRNVNRIGGAKFYLDGVCYPLAANERKNNLHSGPDYYSKRFFNAHWRKDGSTVSFNLDSLDNDQGFPGDAEITVSYILTDDNRLRILYSAVSNKTTVFNFTNHSYFNLAGHDAGDVLGQRVLIHGDAFTMANEESITTGEIVPVEGTPMDFRKEKPIGRDIQADYKPLQMAQGYDHNWVLKNQGETVLAARLSDLVSGRAMEVYTDLPGIQMYTGNYLNNPGKENAYYTKHSGVCFETQYYPNAVNIPSFPSPVYRAGEIYESETVYRFLLQ